MAINRPEVLAPAGSMESLIAAVRSGADGVYLGAKEFSARRNAENFDEASLKEAVTYCHLRGVKVYLTLNTIVRQKEIPAALATAAEAHKAGVDGIIVQDLGLAKLLHENMPALELHASTQMSLHSPAALKNLKGMGFRRVVVSREMSRKALEDFCLEAKRLDMEVEVFVHGALCMSVSGQCLLSAVLGVRSGNRGLCAGPCRLPFESTGGTGYDLSLKDLSLLNHINTLGNMGVASLKIEGRMKRPEYVAAATAACRSAVDNGRVDCELERCLQGVFSRSGFTDGYFTDRLGRDMFGIRTKDDVTEAKDTFAKLHELYRAERQNIEIKMEAVFRKGEPAELTVICGQFVAVAEGDTPEEAVNKATCREDIEASLLKLGSTPYYCKKISVQCDEDIFIRASALNHLRRDALEKLDAMRSAPKSVQIGEYHPLHQALRKPEKQSIIARVADVKDIPAALGADLVVFPYEQDIPDGTDTARLAAELPRWIESEEAVEKRLAELKNAGITAALCGNLSAVALAKAHGFGVIGDIGLNLFNDHSVAVAEELGCSSALLSAETTAQEARHISGNIPLGIFAYGRLPLMLLKNCPLKNGRKCADCDKKGYLTDRLGVKFPVRCRLGYAQLLNSTPVYLADKLDELCGADMLYLYFTDEGADRIKSVIEEYKNGGSCPADFTRGLTFRPSL